MNGVCWKLLCRKSAVLEVSKEEVEDVHALSGAQEKVLGDIQRVLQGEGLCLVAGRNFFG